MHSFGETTVRAACRAALDVTHVFIILAVLYISAAR
jgi:hypothetical protein